jgi:hypothetical protein
MWRSTRTPQHRRRQCSLEMPGEELELMARGCEILLSLLIMRSGHIGGEGRPIWALIRWARRIKRIAPEAMSFPRARCVRAPL